MAAALALGAAGCFTHPINRAPVVTSIDPIGPVVRGQDVMFRAMGSDPDGDPLTWTWAAVPNDCLDAQDLSNWPIHTPNLDPQMQTTTTVDGKLTTAHFCVWAFATDHYGAVGVFNKTVAPGNNPPVAVITLTSPARSDSYPAYTKFQLSGVMSSDPENHPLTYAWKFPDAPQGTFIPCDVTSTTPDPDDTRCFQADLTNVTYTVGLVVTDDSMADSPLTTFPLRVLPDAAPCIVAGERPFNVAFTDADPTVDNSISVTVADDGDPYPNPVMPAQTSHFRWFMGKQGEPLEYVDNMDAAMLTIPAIYQLTDTLIVRLEVRDRTTATNDSLFGCGDSATFCASPAGSTCYQRVTWVIDFAI